MTQQTAAEKWEIGKTYLTRRRGRVRILAIDLRGDFPVCGALMSADGTEEEVLQWRTDGGFNFERERGESTLDLTTVLAP